MENIGKTLNWKDTSLPDLEKHVIQYWKQIDATNKIIEMTKTFPQKIFMDGPPFATGNMHYGHILVSTIKDTMTRYLTMKGFYVDRKNGWDCHGVPIEMLAKKYIGYKTKKELMEFGLDKHNDICRSLVLKCANQWYKDFERIGRWVDTKNEYKTMDRNFMESVIWAFKKLYKQGMIFEGVKVMPYSTGCNTPLSHFEAKQNYKNTTDPSIVCGFEIISSQYSIFKHASNYPSYILVWTTTPWTLPSNMAICTYMYGEIIYAFDNELKIYIMVSREKFESTYLKMKFNNTPRYHIIERIISNDLINIEYRPPFDYFWKEHDQEHLPIENRAFRVIADHFVKESGQVSGTGFVHCFSPETLVLMENFNYKRISDIKIGDKVWGDDNTLRNVINVIPKQKGKMYKIQQGKLEPYFTNGEHILVLIAYNVEPNFCPNKKILSWWTKCNKNICKNNNGISCGGIIKISKILDNGHEPLEYIKNLKLRTLDPNIVLDGDIFEISVINFINLCVTNAKRKLHGFQVNKPSINTINKKKSNNLYSLETKNNIINISNTCLLIVSETNERNEFCGITVDGNKRFLLYDYTVVHNCAPAFGEDDFRVCCENNIIDIKNSRKNIINPVDDDGRFTNVIKDYAGIYVKDADKLIIKDLKNKKLLFESKQYTHSYPFCYRTDTPLLYRIVSAWFLNASNEQFREKMLENNKKINWMPADVGTNHFDNWLQSSVDWCISRSRYWGTPIPIWRSDDGMETVCIGSIAELEELSGIKNIIDLHIEYIDKIKIPSKEGRGMLSRVEGVLDCWFESGSMPYAQNHYPFENNSLIDPSKNYISDFITESKDQTRGWFYTLTVLATALFNKPAFQNVIVTGIINGADGQKMSKSKGNYPDPNILMDKYGADTLRLYLLSTPVVKAESIKFDENALSKLQQNSIVKIYNITLFLVEKINLFNNEYPRNTIKYPLKSQLESLDNILDKWIINKTGLLLKEINNDLDGYKINSIGHKILNYIEQLTNWYLKMARERMKGYASRFNTNDRDWKQAIETLLFVMIQFNKIIAPIIPFTSEIIYTMLKRYIPNVKDSVHFDNFPTIEEFVFNQTLEEKFNIIQKVIILIREIRDVLKFNNRRPISCAQIGCINSSDWNIIQDILEYVKTESNVLHIIKMDTESLVKCKAEPNMQELSFYLKQNGQIKKIKQIMQFINTMSFAEIQKFQHEKCIKEPSTNIILTTKHINIKYSLNNDDPTCKISDNIIVKLDSSYTDEVKTEHLIRLINTAIQMHRKNVCLKPWQIINIYFYTNSEELYKFILDHLSEFHSKNINIIEFRQQSSMTHNKTIHDIIGKNLDISSQIIN